MPTLKDDIRCTFVREDGHRCRRGRIMGKERCYQHQYNAQTFENSLSFLKNRLYLDSAEGIHFLLARVTTALANGKLEPRRASAIGYLAQVMISSLNKMKDERERLKFRNEDEAGEDRETVREFLHDYLLYSNDWENAEEDEATGDTENAVALAHDIKKMEADS